MNVAQAEKDNKKQMLKDLIERRKEELNRYLRFVDTIKLEIESYEERIKSL